MILFTKYVRLRIVLFANIAGLIAMTVNTQVVDAQDFSYYDSFDDGDISRTTEHGFSLYACQGSTESGQLNEDNDFEMHVPGFWTLWCPREYDGERLVFDDEWSIRTRVSVDNPPSGFAVGTQAYQHVGVVNNGRTMSVGTNSTSTEQARWEQLPFPFRNTTLYFQMDAFDRVVTGSIWPEGDLDSLIQFSYPYQPSRTIPAFGLDGGTATFHDLWIASQPIPILPSLVGDFDANGVLDASDLELLVDNLEMVNPSYDLTGDGVIDLNDHRFWVKDAKNTWYGDANLDGEFNSGDFVEVFKAGKYEVDAEAGWHEGDWNADQRFDSGDFVEAFKDGGYERGPRAEAANAVPEPSGVFLIVLAGFVLFARLRR